jgi:hypothetical protein
MLEASMSLTRRCYLEQVAVDRCTARRRAAEEIDVPLTQPAEVAREALEVPLLTAGDRDFVRDAARRKRSECEVADLDRMIDQLVVVRRVIATESLRRGGIPRQRRCDAPVHEFGARRRRNLDAARNLLVSVGTQEYAGAVEIRS